jgi:hypothetical protein
MLRWAVATAAIIATVSGCSSSSSGPAITLDVSNPDAAVQRATDAMSHLNSYHMDMTFSPEGTDITVPAEFDRGNYYERISDPEKGESTELILAGGFFTRQCSGQDHCEQWVRTDFDVPSATILPTRSRYAAPTLGGLTTVFPETLALTAVDLASGWQVKEGSADTLVGQVDLSRTIDENRSRNGIPTDPGPDVMSSSPVEVPPSTIELHLSTEGPYFQSVRIGIPGDPADPYFVVEFSRYNDVSVQAPSEYTTGPSY